jgi:hypothetical protein
MANPREMKLGVIFTQPIQDHDNGGEIGQFVLEVTVDKKMFLASADKPGLIRRQFAAHLASASLDTHVPVEYWQGKVEEKVASLSGVPQQFNFSVRR